MKHVLIVGGGIFGLSAAWALRLRGWPVTLLDPGPLPHPLAASTDISKAVRIDYGTNSFYTRLGERAIGGWRRWNALLGSAVYHEVGFLPICRETMQPGGFEYDSWQTLRAHGHRPQRVTRELLARRFPAFNAELYADGYFNALGGYAESGRCVTLLAAAVARAGVDLRANTRTVELTYDDQRVTGVLTQTGERLAADIVVVAAGAWTPRLLPHLADRLRVIAQPIMCFDVRADMFRAPQLPVWGADIARTGWYGFPALANGVFKVASHGPGRVVEPDVARTLDDSEEERFREFLATTFPAAANAPRVEGRLCLYCDSFDGDFLVDHDPERPGLVVASGGSGHAFKFAPVLGDLIANVVDGTPDADAAHFAWRERTQDRSEAARHTGDATR